MTMPIDPTPPPTPSEQDRCPFCNLVVGHEMLSCPGCGAPLKFRSRKTDSGWTELPPIKDMARLRIGNTTCQIEGEYVPVADFNLAAGDGVYFAHHVMLWCDPQVEIRTLPMGSALKRMIAGMPLVMTEAIGPGHIAFSRDLPGEMIAVPLQAGQSIHAREHVFLAATQQVKVDWLATGIQFTTGTGKDVETHYPIGMFLDVFSAPKSPGLLLLHAGGNAFIRDLAAGEQLMIKPTSFLFKDPTVHMGLRLEHTGSFNSFGTFSGSARQYLWLHLVGPGRVALQSAYPPMEGGHGYITGTSGQAFIPMRYGSSQLTPAAAAASAMRKATSPPFPQMLGEMQRPMQKLVEALMLNGEISPEAMAELLAEGSKHGLSKLGVERVIAFVRAEQLKKS